MNERQMQFAVGLVVFATIIIGGLLATVNSPVPSDWLPWGRGTYRISIELQQAPGVGPDTPVRKSGLLIGRVESIEDLDDRILVHANIEAGRRLFPQYACQVRTSVLGDATIDFVTTPIPPGTPPLADGAVVRGSFETIDEDCRFVIRGRDGSLTRIAAGDVHFGAVASAAAI